MIIPYSSEYYRELRLEKIVFYNDYAELTLYNSKGEETAKTKVDLLDKDFIIDYGWYMNSNGYVVRQDKKEGKMYQLHRQIMGVTDKKVYIDHINLDKTDNRRSNLRLCTPKENARNRGLDKRNKSGKVGVHFVKERGLWTATIRIDGKYTHLGFYETKEEAIDVRIKAELKYYGEFSPLSKEGVIDGR